MEVGPNLPNPWFPYVVVGGALLVTLSTGLIPVRGLPAAIRQWFRPQRVDHHLLLAASAGMSSVLGAALAVQTGGPGALIWMWIATLLGMSLVYAETTAAASPRQPLQSELLGTAGRWLGIVGALGMLGFALTTEALQVQQIGALVHDVGGSLPIFVVALAVIALAILTLRLPSLQRSMLRWGVPLAVLFFIGTALLLAVDEPQRLGAALHTAFDAAFGLEPLAGGSIGASVAVALHYGVLRAVAAGNLGVGAAAMAVEGKASHEQGVGAMLVPLLAAGLLSTCGAAVLLSGSPAEPIAMPKAVPMIRAENGGLRPSARVGQTIVLPEHTTMEADKAYAMYLWPSSRGHQLGKLFKEDNRVVVPGWALTNSTNTVIFHSRDRENQAGWDVRIECNRSIIGEGERHLVALAPKDPEINFAKVISFYELDPQPYVDTSDLSFIGMVEEATSADRSGTYLAMYEAPTAERPLNPKLHEMFRMGFRGPYNASSETRAPLGFIAREGFQPPLGSVVKLRLEPDPRGIDIARVHRAGGVESPPWPFLGAVDTLLVRHESDPGRDILIPVRVEHDGYRTRYKALDPQWGDFRQISKMEGFKGPYVVVPPFDFEVEVRSDARLPITYAGHRALIPLDLPPEVVGPSNAFPQPHPMELIEAGMSGPYLVEEGLAPVTARIEERFGIPGIVIWVVAILLLALGAMVAWALLAQRLLETWFDTRISRALGVLLLAMGGLGAVASLRLLVAWMDVALIVAVVPNILALALALPHLRRPSPTAAPS